MKSTLRSSFSKIRLLEPLPVLHTVTMYIMFLFEVRQCLLRFCCIDRVIIDKTNKGNDFLQIVYFLPYNHIASPNTASLQTRVSDCLCEHLGNTLLRGIFSLQEEGRPRKYATKEAIASPNHIPEPIRGRASTPRMCAKAERLSMAKRGKSQRQ